MQECLNSINSFLTAPYTAWFPITLIAATLIIVILAAIYLFAPLMGREDIRRNIGIMIYQTLFGIVLIMAFGIFATWLCSFNAESILQSLNLILVDNIPQGVHIPYNGNLYETALYDLYWFTNYGALANTNTFSFFLFAALNIGPQLDIKIDFIPGVEDLGVSAQGPFTASNILGSYFGYMSQALGWLFIINDLQFIIISAAPIIFAIFVSIGLIARLFGFSRNFGGSLIALGVGIGFVYPLMVSITYGFINVAYSQLYNNMFINIVTSAFGTNIQSALASLASGSALVNLFLSGIYSIVNLVGFTATASLILPILNFVVVNTFVIDFSQAFGEKLDFMSLLANII
jgi:hypothetical protein